MKGIIFILLFFFTAFVVSSQDTTSVINDLEAELQRWDKKWTFDDYIKGSVHISEMYFAKANGCFLVDTPILAEDKELEGIYARGYFYVDRFGWEVKTTFESFIFYEDNEKVVRICYKDNIEGRCNH